jgi:hypothetical protein
MGLKSLISNVISRLTYKVGLLTTSHTPVSMVVTAAEPSVEPGSKRGRPPKRPTALNFDLAEAVRLHRTGVGWKKIARRMSNVSWQTVSRRVKEYEAAQAVAQPVVQPEPVAPTSPLSKPSAVAEVIPEHSRIELDPPPELKPALPVDNAEGLLRGRPWLDQDLAFKSWRKIFFVVNGSNPVNLAYCGNNGWFAVALERWRESFAALALFEEATHIWVILNPADDNEAFLHSFVNDIQIRERCKVAVGSPLDIAKYAHDAGIPYKISFECFERACGFSPMPQPNHVEIIARLLQKAKPPEPERMKTSWQPDWQMGGSGASSGYSGVRIEVPSSGSNPNGSANGNDGSGFAF